MSKKINPKVPDLCENLLTSLKVIRLEEENAALTKRVAELEEQVKQFNDIAESLRDKVRWSQHQFDEQQNIIDNLQSQLAWTPVPDGMPSKPGWYAFTDVDCGSPEFLNLNPGYWPETKGWNDNFKGVNPAAPDWGYTHYRRVELPQERKT